MSGFCLLLRKDELFFPLARAWGLGFTDLGFGFRVYGFGFRGRRTVQF